MGLVLHRGATGRAVFDDPFAELVDYVLDRRV